MSHQRELEMTQNSLYEYPTFALKSEPVPDVTLNLSARPFESVNGKIAPTSEDVKVPFGGTAPAKITRSPTPMVISSGVPPLFAQDTACLLYTSPSPRD